jgi:hypothetical protein
MSKASYRRAVAAFNEDLRDLIQRGQNMTPAQVRALAEEILARAALPLAQTEQLQLRRQLAWHCAMLSQPSGWNWPAEDAMGAFAEWLALVKDEPWHQSELAAKLMYSDLLVKGGQIDRARAVLDVLRQRVAALPEDYTSGTGVGRGSMLRAIDGYIGELPTTDTP